MSRRMGRFDSRIRGRRRRRRDVTARSSRPPASITTPRPARPARRTCTATSSSWWRCSSSINPGAWSLCLCCRGCTCARRICRRSTRSIAPISAPSSWWPSSCWGGRSGGSACWGGRSGWSPTAPTPRRTCRRRRRRWGSRSSAGSARTRPCGRSPAPSPPADAAPRRPTAPGRSTWPSGPARNEAGLAAPSTCTTARPW